MTMRELAIDDRCRGSLWLGSMPGRFERWAEFVAAARSRKVALVLCLAPPEEVATLSPAYADAIGEGRLDFRVLHVPMQNYGLPDDVEAFRAGIDEAVTRLVSGDAVLLHCAAGIGRTGTAAACLLKRMGLPTAEALQRVRDAGSNPENAVQSGLVDRF